MAQFLSLELSSAGNVKIALAFTQFRSKKLLLGANKNSKMAKDKDKNLEADKRPDLVFLTSQ